MPTCCWLFLKFKYLGIILNRKQRLKKRREQTKKKQNYGCKQNWWNANTVDQHHKIETSTPQLTYMFIVATNLSEKRLVFIFTIYLAVFVLAHLPRIQTCIPTASQVPGFDISAIEKLQSFQSNYETIDQMSVATFDLLVRVTLLS